jgi:hypothetical protein
MNCTSNTTQILSDSQQQENHNPESAKGLTQNHSPENNQALEKDPKDPEIQINTRTPPIANDPAQITKKYQSELVTLHNLYSYPANYNFYITALESVNQLYTL